MRVPTADLAVWGWIQGYDCLQQGGGLVSQGGELYYHPQEGQAVKIGLCTRGRATIEDHLPGDTLPIIKLKNLARRIVDVRNQHRDQEGGRKATPV